MRNVFLFIWIDSLVNDFCMVKCEKQKVKNICVIISEYKFHHKHLLNTEIKYHGYKYINEFVIIDNEIRRSAFKLNQLFQCCCFIFLLLILRNFIGLNTKNVEYNAQSQKIHVARYMEQTFNRINIHLSQYLLLKL